jgi:hypothetical protein
MTDDSNNPYLLETPAEKIAREQTEEKRRENTQRSIQLWFNGILAMFAIVTAGAVIYQGSVMHDQLTQMQQASIQSSQLIVNAAHQASDTHALAVAAGKQAGQAVIQANAARVSANAAKSAADTARDALVIGNRPWIKVDLWQTAPLEFLPDGSAKIGIQEKIENIGSSVALRVESWFNIFPLGSASDTFLAAKARQKEGCDAIRFPKSTILEGEEMFPHDPMLYSYAETIAKDQIVPIKDNAPGMGGKVGQVGFILAGCVTYRSSFENPTVPSHETLFEYWIAKPAERGGVIPFLDPVGTHPNYSIFRLQNGLTAN